MALIKCDECGQDVSERALACPKCGVTPPKPYLVTTRRTGYLAMMLVILLAVVALGYRMFLTEGERDAVNRISSAVGVPVTPWVDRAQAAMRAMLSEPKQQEVIARSVVTLLHPTGNSPQVETFDVRALGETLVVSVTVGWKGGFLGNRYRTIVTWKCTRTQSLGVTLALDSGPFGVGDSNLRALSNWMQTEVYPVLLSNAG